MNEKNHITYSDNFNLRVVDLTQIHIATSEDKEFQIDYWASLFKSKTWEELKMIAEKNEYMKEASLAEKDKEIARMKEMIRKLQANNQDSEIPDTKR